MLKRPKPPRARSSLRNQKSKDSIMELDLNPPPYSAIVLNFCSKPLIHIENIFRVMVQKRLRHDVVAITTTDIEEYILSNKEDVLLQGVPDLILEGKEIPFGNFFYVLNILIEKSVAENERLLSVREERQRLDYLAYWKSIYVEPNMEEPGKVGKGGKGVKREKSKTKSEKMSKTSKTKTSTPNKKEKKEKGDKKKSGKGKKSKTDLPQEEKVFEYIIPELELFSFIWSKITKRGQQSIDKAGIEDFPLLGPRLYVILFNFTNIELISKIKQEGIPINSVLQLYQNEPDTQLIDLSQKSLDEFKTCSFHDILIPYLDGKPECRSDILRLFGEMCHMIYDAEDIRRQYGNFLNNYEDIDLTEMNCNKSMEAYSENVRYELLFDEEIVMYNLITEVERRLERSSLGTFENSQQSIITNSIKETNPIRFHILNQFQILEKSDLFYRKLFILPDDLEKLDLLKIKQTCLEDLLKMNEPKCLENRKLPPNFNYLKFLTKFAFKQILLKLDLNQDGYKKSAYLLPTSNLILFGYKKIQHKKIFVVENYKNVVLTRVCFRDYNEYVTGEIQEWIKKQEHKYKDMLELYVYEKYLKESDRKLEFKIKYHKDADFMFKNSFKREKHIQQMEIFKELKMFEEGETSQVVSSTTSGLNKEFNVVKPQSAKKRPTLYVRMDADSVDSSSSSNISTDIVISKESLKPIVPSRKRFLGYDLDDRRCEINGTKSTFRFIEGKIVVTLEKHLYHSTYINLQLKFYGIGFYFGKIINNKKPQDIQMQITEIDTINILLKNDIRITLGVDEPNIDDVVGCSFRSTLPNGLYTQSLFDQNLNQFYIEQKWPNNKNNETRRLYFQNGIVVVFYQNDTKNVYTASGSIYVFNDEEFDKIYEVEEAEAEEELWHAGEGENNFEEVSLDENEFEGEGEEEITHPNIYENEINFINYLSSYFVIDKFKLILADGNIVYVDTGIIQEHIVKKLRSRESFDYVQGEIYIRREDKFKMIINTTEQIVLFPDETIIRSTKLTESHDFDNNKEETIHHNSMMSFEGAAGDEPKRSGNRKQIPINLMIEELMDSCMQDYFQKISVETYECLHEDYSAITFEEENEIKIENYDKSVEIWFLNGKGVRGTFPSNNLTFQFTETQLKIGNDKVKTNCNLNSNNNLLLESYDSDSNKLIVYQNGTTGFVQEKFLNCPLTVNKDRYFLAHANEDDFCFEIINTATHNFNTASAKLVQETDTDLLILNEQENSDNAFKLKLKYMDKFPETVSVKNVDCGDCKPGTRCFYLKTIPSLLNFEYFFKFDQEIADDFYEKFYLDHEKLAEICEQAINCFVDLSIAEWEKTIVKPPVKRSKRFRHKMEEINKRLERKDVYKSSPPSSRQMLKNNTKPKYSDFREADSHVRNLDIDRYKPPMIVESKLLCPIYDSCCSSADAMRLGIDPCNPNPCPQLEFFN